MTQSLSGIHEIQKKKDCVKELMCQETRQLQNIFHTLWSRSQLSFLMIWICYYHKSLKNCLVRKNVQRPQFVLFLLCYQKAVVQRGQQNNHKPESCYVSQSCTIFPRRKISSLPYSYKQVVDYWMLTSWLT